MCPSLPDFTAKRSHPRPPLGPPRLVPARLGSVRFGQKPGAPPPAVRRAGSAETRAGQRRVAETLTHLICSGTGRVCPGSAPACPSRHPREPSRGCAESEKRDERISMEHIEIKLAYSHRSRLTYAHGTFDTAAQRNMLCEIVRDLAAIKYQLRPAFHKGDYYTITDGVMSRLITSRAPAKKYNLLVGTEKRPTSNGACRTGRA